MKPLTRRMAKPMEILQSCIRIPFLQLMHTLKLVLV
jgi:hypothetical protein